jgi:cysteine desulfurase
MVALGTACELARERLAAGGADHVRALRDRLHARLQEGVPGLALNGHLERRLPNTLNVSFPGQDGEELLARTPGIAASTGSACHAGRTEPSGVLTAMGIPRDRALGAVRLSLGHPTTADEVDAAATALIQSATIVPAGR